MQSEDLERLQELLSVASRLTTAAHASFLERAEPNRTALRNEAASLLRYHAGSGELSSPQLVELAQVGPYILHDRLGEAPPARLYRASTKEEPGRARLVAVAGPGPAAARVAAALKDQVQRQQIIADPTFARLTDAGSTEGGHVYACFEFFAGVPLEEFADVLALSITDRVALIEQVALAVERGHERGLAPLGLMPWSILGTWCEQEPGIGLISLDPWPLLALLEPERRAQAGILDGLETAAPEALRGEARGVASDVFALGALLFRSATGTAPLGLRNLASRRSLREELRTAAQVVPPLASDRMLGLGRSVVDIARRRSTEPNALLRELRSGLDDLLARSLSLEPSSRPPSAAAFAGELAEWRQSRGVGLIAAAQRLRRRLGGRWGWTTLQGPDGSSIPPPNETRR